MRDANKTKAQLVEELADSRQRIAELEAAETERVRTEGALRTAELEKDAVFNNVVEHAINEDTEMKVLWPERSEPFPEGSVVEAFETGHPQEEDKTTPDGRRWFIRDYPVRDQGGDVIGAVEVALDITEGKQIEAELLVKNEVFEASITANSTSDNEGILTSGRQTDQ
jgi:PAS domain-containing protein